MIGVPVVQYIGLTGGSVWSLVHIVSRMWARCCNGRAGVDVGASPCSESYVDLILQCWSWSAVGAGSLVV